MNCRHCCPLISLSQELLRRIAWVDFGGVYYGTWTVSAWVFGVVRQGGKPVPPAHQRPSRFQKEMLEAGQPIVGPGMVASDLCRIGMVHGC